MVECYWFAGYDYTAGEALFRVGANPDPNLGGTFGDDATPPRLDTIEGYGALGFGTPGYCPCPPGEGGLDGPGGGGGDQPDGGRQVLSGHVPPDIARLGLQPIGQLPDTMRMNLAVSLPVRDRGALEQLVRDVSDPSSMSFRHYITPEEFAARFGPLEGDYNQVVGFIASHNLRVTREFRSHIVLDVAGSVADIQRAFHIRLLRYNHPTEHREFVAPDSEPSLDLEAPVLCIDGLSDFFVPHPCIREGTRPTRIRGLPHPCGGSGPENSYFGYDFRNAYLPGVSLTGAGQFVGIAAYSGGYYPTDIAQYEYEAGLPFVQTDYVLLDGYPGGPGDYNKEVSLDIEMAVSMAPGLTGVIVFEGYLCPGSVET